MQLMMEDIVHKALTFEERTEMLSNNKDEFIKLVDKSLRHQFELITKLVDRGTYFFDYGNSFMKAIFDAGGKGNS